MRNHILYLPDSEVTRINPNLTSSWKLNLCGEIMVFSLLLALSIGLLANLGMQYQRTDQLEVWMSASL